MQIEKHIGELLFEHDCVIIPDFGGFVCNYSPAGIHGGKNKFHPPFKKISFNRNLKNNDGLLANQISLAESVSFSEANRLMAECTGRWKSELSAGRRVDLKNIGAFYPGEENTISFEQDETVNYLPESFGLSAFYSPAIKREPLVKKMEQTFKDTIIVPSKEKKEIVARKGIPAARYLAVAASLLIVASMVFVFLKIDLLKNTNFANLNPFAEKAIALYDPNNADALPDIAKENVSNILDLNRNDTTRYLNILINGNIPIVVSLQDEKKEIRKENKAKSQKHTLSKAEGLNHFHVIGGAFAIPTNAEKFVAKLKKLGYDAQIIDRKLHMVSYGKFSTRKEALEAMEKIRAVQSDVWLMTN